MKKLIINTSDNKLIKVGLMINNKLTEEIESDSKILRSEAAIPLIDKLLKKQKLNFYDLEEIEVFVGPGSYTGLRVGVSIANALGYLLNIPVNGKKVGELVSPVYN
jgi:tRNA threonylcarbamoyladenosine biosynthesis protein TsaB